MNTLTARRSFGQPSYTPAKRVRILAARMYLVTFQNTESDPRTDYHGLAEGEHVKLLTGDQARAARDARLNHCNAIQEYTGPFSSAQVRLYGSDDPWNLSAPEYLRPDDIGPWLEKQEARRLEHLAGLEKEMKRATDRLDDLNAAKRMELERYPAMSDETFERNVECWRATAENCMRQIGRNQVPWPTIIIPMRGAKPDSILLRETSGFFAYANGLTVRIVAKQKNVRLQQCDIARETWRALNSYNDQSFEMSVVMELGVGAFEK